MEHVYEIGQAYIRFDINANEDFKKEFEKYLLNLGKKFSTELYHREFLEGNIHFLVEFEDGSLKSRLKIFGKLAIGALVMYGGVRTGVDYIIRDSQAITEHVAITLSNDPNVGNQIRRVERRLGIPGKIKRLYNDINKLQNDRDNLTEIEQTRLVEKIQNNFESLLDELDNQEIQTVRQYLMQENIPVPNLVRNHEYEYPLLYAIREDEIRLISEDEINEDILMLPPPN